MGSRSTNTYSELIEDYNSTQDSKLWHSRYLNAELSDKLVGQENATIALTDDETIEFDGFPYKVNLEMMEEMIMEPLLFVPEPCKDTISALCSPELGDIVVCLSTYGLKHLMFRLVGCLLCLDGNRQKLYIPSRLFKKVYIDSKDKCIDCLIPKKESRNIYNETDVPIKLWARCEEVYNMSEHQRTTSNHKQLLADNFNLYCIVDITMCIVLSPSRGSPHSDSSGTPIVQHEKRKVSATPLWVDTRTTDIRNVVATTTKDVDYYREIREWSSPASRMRSE